MARRVVLVLLAIAGFGALAAGGVESHHEPDHAYHCEPDAEPPALLQTRRVLVYLAIDRTRADFVGCHRPTRRHHLFADALRDEYIFATPTAVDARRSIVGYAVRDQGRTVVEVRDVAVPTDSYHCAGCGGLPEPEPLRRLPAAYHPRRELGVDALALGRDNALAWTTCPLGPKYPRGGDLAYDKCFRPHGARFGVWRARAGASKPDLLYAGPDLDPDSLRLKRGRIFWRGGGRVHSARL